MRRIILSIAAVNLAACASPHAKTGPRAQGVTANAPRDTIGIMLSWTPDQTLVNFREVDRLFATHTIRHGAYVRPLPRAFTQIDPIVTQSDNLPAVSIEQLMRSDRITGIIAVKNGEIILERYAWGHRPEDRWISMSVAKGLMAILIGAAVKDGLIHSIDDPVVGYVPELRGTAYDGVTIRNLLTMSSGVRYREDVADATSDVALAGGAPMTHGVAPLVAYAARLEREAKPGTRRKYKTIDYDIAGIVLSRALKGRTAADYLSEKIWQPFGMETDATWVIDKVGIERGGCCLSITLRDYARFGLFVADGGRANGVEVLPNDWLKDAWTPQLSEKPDAYIRGYGWHWQIRQDGGYETVGAYGQSVTVYPTEHLVIAVNAASANPHGIGLARWDLISAIRAASH